jgi:hypothetical protein
VSVVRPDLLRGYHFTFYRERPLPRHRMKIIGIYERAVNVENEKFGHLNGRRILHPEPHARANRHSRLYEERDYDSGRGWPSDMN